MPPLPNVVCHDLTAVCCAGVGQVFAYTKRGQVMSDDNCLDNSGDSAVKMVRCHGMGGNQRWKYDQEVRDGPVQPEGRRDSGPDPTITATIPPPPGGLGALQQGRGIGDRNRALGAKFPHMYYSRLLLVPCESTIPICCDLW